MVEKGFLEYGTKMFFVLRQNGSFGNCLLKGSLGNPKMVLLLHPYKKKKKTFWSFYF